MKIDFDNRSSIEVSYKDDKIFIVIKATDFKNNNKLIVNTATLSKDQFKELMNDKDLINILNSK